MLSVTHVECLLCSVSFMLNASFCYTGFLYAEFSVLSFFHVFVLLC
jgi:hypothetical protein